MSSDPNDLLAKELAKLAALGGSVGQILSGAGDAGNVAEHATSLGVRFAMRFMPTERYTEKLSLAMPPDKALKIGCSALSKLGSLQKQDEQSPYPVLTAVIGSGMMNLNPAVVYFEILEATDSKCEITLTGAAKEGLIKQHTAEKAVKRAVNEIRNLS
ncbi:MAG: hypothetical protein U0670_08900 [Anaerolineae bacterium]